MNQISNRLLRVLVVAGLILFSPACGPIGDHYEDVDAIGMSESWKEWIILGRFGPQGPYTLMDVKYCEVGRPCNFSHHGQAHTYDGFEDFRLAVLRLEGADGEISHVILRSNEKFAGEQRDW
jgi:hypothetical protein